VTGEPVYTQHNIVAIKESRVFMQISERTPNVALHVHFLLLLLVQVSLAVNGKIVPNTKKIRI
jgi:hypothetical protein